MSNILYQWKERIFRSSLPPLTRLVLFNLLFYMDSKTGTCFPSTKQQASSSGLSERSVCTHLDIAEKAGFITKNKTNFQGKAWARHEYKIAFPSTEGSAGDSMPNCKKALKEVQCEEGEGTEGGSVRNKIKALKEVQCEGHYGTEGDDIKALKEVQSNYPKELSKESLSTPMVPNGDDVRKVEQIVDDDFEELWREYVTSSVPKGSKQKARQKYGHIRKAGTGHAEIIEGLRRYAHHITETGHYSKQVITWLNGRGWQDDYHSNYIAKRSSTHNAYATMLTAFADVLADE